MFILQNTGKANTFHVAVINGYKDIIEIFLDESIIVHMQMFLTFLSFLYVKK